MKITFTSAFSPSDRAAKRSGIMPVEMVDGLAQSQLVPVVHRRDPRAPRSDRHEFGGAARVGGPCGPTGASVLGSGSRRRLAQIEGADLMSAEQDVETAILVGRTQRDATLGKGPAEFERTVAEAQPAVRVDAAHDRPGTVVKRFDRLRKAPFARTVARCRVARASASCGR